MLPALPVDRHEGDPAPGFRLVVPRNRQARREERDLEQEQEQNAGTYTDI